MGFHLLIRYVENLRRQGNSSNVFCCVQPTIHGHTAPDHRSLGWDVYRWITPCLLSMQTNNPLCWACGMYYIYIYIYTRVLSIVSIKVWTLYKMSWNHVSIRLDVSNMHLFWCKLSWMGPWGFHRIASSEDIPRQGPHPSGTLENNRLCPLTDCWQHASHFLKHLESCLPKTIKLRQREAYMGF